MTAQVDFSGRAVLVTGVGRRGQVGEIVARAFGDSGARLFIVDRNPDEVTAREKELTSLGLQVRSFACDLTDPDAVATVAGQVDAAAPSGLDVLVNLAGGFAASGPIAASDPAIWHRQIAVNLSTAYVTTRAFLPLVRRTKGAIVYFASAAALPGASVSEIAAYAAAKSGVITLMRAVAAEEKKNGVRANALAPTSVRTDANVASMGENASYVERETVADWVMWLASSTAGPVSGQVIKLG